MTDERNKELAGLVCNALSMCNAMMDEARERMREVDRRSMTEAQSQAYETLEMNVDLTDGFLKDIMDQMFDWYHLMRTE